MRVLLSVLVVAAAFVLSADACGRHDNKFGNGNSAILITPRRPPIQVPPSPAPTPPPPPPPIPVGWVPAPPRPPAQEMTRTNCKARVEFKIIDDGDDTADSTDRSLVQEHWVYTCKFQVYVEIAVAKTNQAVNCACGLSHSRKTNALPDPNFQKAHKTQITNFNMVSFDSVRLVVVHPFPADTFQTLTPNDNTTNELKRAASTPGMDYANVVQGFSGKVKALTEEKFPPSLRKGGDKYSPAVVPAMCFTVEEEYISSYKWPEPPRPVLHTTPNVWVTKCVPLTGNNDRVAQRKRADFSKQRYWFKDFLLFPRTGGSGGGFQPKARYITSWYLDSNCSPETGVVSFVREFDSVIKRERTYKVYGAFAWERTYSNVWVVGGTPLSFRNNMAFQRLGYTQITWKEVYGRESATKEFRQGVVYHALLGTKANPQTPNIPFTGASEITKLCQRLPDEWETCEPIDGSGCADLRTKAYNEHAFMFRLPADALTGNSKTFDCTKIMSFCEKETTFLSFQNHGGLARDYSKRQDSLLLTGPRELFCKAYPTRPVFDAMYFTAQRSGPVQMVRKRAALQDGADPELDMINQKTDFTEAGEINAVPGKNVGAEPEVEDVVLQPATGSADANGRPGGDHPLTLFPETYTVPVTLDPRDTTYDNGRGTLFDGQDAPCLEGSRGCTCRKQDTGRVRPACDAPLECNADTSFCEPPVCVPGQVGCPCIDGNTCASAAPFNVVCTTENVCAFSSTCKPGDNGCACNENNACNDDKAECNIDEGYCALTVEDTCTAGEAGCECTEDSKCNGEGITCSVDGMCVAPQCNSGTRGCRCELGLCEAGFECTPKNVCKQSVCPEGMPGCACAAGRTCTVTGFACRDFKKDGSDARCVAEGKNCGDQTSRCIKFCGAGNVVRCPPCSNQQPQCAGAAHVVPSVLVALALAVLAALF